MMTNEGVEGLGEASMLGRDPLVAVLEQVEADCDLVLDGRLFADVLAAQPAVAVRAAQGLGLKQRDPTPPSRRSRA